MRFPLLAIALTTACGSNNNSTVDAPKAIDGKAIDAEAIDAAPDAPPADTVVTLSGAANALLWDAATSTLFLTDNMADTLLKYTDANGIQTVAALPNGAGESAGISLGGIEKEADGSFVIADFGFGTQGTLFSVPATGTATAATGMDATRRRIGLAQDSAGALYSSYFVKSGTTFTGGVATVTLAAGTNPGDPPVATETEVAGGSTTAGFGKVVGLAASTTAVFVSDQSQSKIFKLAVPGFALTTVATVPTADILIMMPNGDLLTGGGAAISRVTQAGVVSTLPNTGFENVEGLAFDPAGHRLFIIDHSATAGVPDKLHIQPLAN